MATLQEQLTRAFELGVRKGWDEAKRGYYFDVETAIVELDWPKIVEQILDETD